MSQHEHPGPCGLHCTDQPAEQRHTVDTITSDQLDALQLVAGKAAQLIDRWSAADDVARRDLWRELGAALSELDALDPPKEPTP